MFNIPITKYPYQDPWCQTLEARFKMLLCGSRRIAYFYEEPNNSTFRYRAYNMVQVLNETPGSDVSAAYFFLTDLSQADDIADLADVLVICRSRYCHRVNDLILKFRRRRKRVFYDVDDLVFNPDYVHLIMTTLDQDADNSNIWDYWYAYTGRMGAALRLCDAAITTNPYLADQITAFSGLPVGMVPNFINREQYDFSDKIFQMKQSSGFKNDGPVHLGYFSGSPSHDLDFDMIVPALADLLDADSRLEVTLTGYIDIPAALSRFGGRIRRLPFSDYVNLQGLVGRVEFNLVPLQSNVFTHCKSELKYFEAAIAGTLTIASPTFTYAAAIRDGENGYMARAHQWGSVIQRAIQNIDQYEDMATVAFRDARAKYAWFNQYERILTAFGWT